MLYKLIALLLLLGSIAGCAGTRSAQPGPVKPKPFVTPYEYYSKTRPAVFGAGDSVRVEKAAVHSTGEETKDDHTQAIIIGTLVGVSVIGGTVAGILLAR